MFTDHSTLKYLFSKHDANPRLIRWVLLLQEFYIDIKEKKGMENPTVDHLSRLENPKLEGLNEGEFDDNFPDEYLMMITEEVHWFVDIMNFLASDYLLKGFSYQQKRRPFFDLKHYFWDDPYLFRSCAETLLEYVCGGREAWDIL